MKIKKERSTKTGIDMTPMIDVVFQLLTFFMITSTVIKTSAINVDLPSA
ncbi:MAG: biopolymer transporter ExbD, partial [Brevinematales bacterium]|nr:biopolymer transporter ExbD [Brevinematales bacterium]